MLIVFLLRGGCFIVVVSFSFAVFLLGGVCFIMVVSFSLAVFSFIGHVG